MEIIDIYCKRVFGKNINMQYKSRDAITAWSGEINALVSGEFYLHIFLHVFNVIK